MGRISKLLALLIALACPFVADAATYTYTYTGNFFTEISNSGTAPVYNTSNHLTGSFTLDAPLGSDLSGPVGYLGLQSITPASFSFTDGNETITDASPNLRTDTSHFYVRTDSDGNIQDWGITLVMGNVTGDLTLGQQLTTETGTYAQDFGIYELHDITDPSHDIGYSSGTVRNSPGTWNLSSTSGTGSGNGSGAVTPEPGTLLLTATGSMTGLWLRMRRFTWMEKNSK